MSFAEQTGLASSMALQPLEPGGQLERHTPAPGPLAVAHVSSTSRCYPGEILTLYTRVAVRKAVPGFAVQISVPPGLAAGPYQASSNHGRIEPELVIVDDDRYVRWTVDRPLSANEIFEYELKVAARPTLLDIVLESHAMARPTGPANESIASAESTTISVKAKGRYIKHLPRVFEEQDEMMGRFLMLFESFWAPIEGQIDAIHHYFDPALAPLDLLPWLASWVDLTLDDHWPEAKRRQLLKAAVSLYRKRGTRRGLQEYLEIYTGAQVRVSEHGANNFLLGTTARLGPGVALGTLNMPHTFTVTVYLPAAGNGHHGPEAQARYEADRRKMIEAIIEAEKPAHTSYNLRLESL